VAGCCGYCDEPSGSGATELGSGQHFSLKKRFPQVKTLQSTVLKEQIHCRFRRLLWLVMQNDRFCLFTYFWPPYVVLR
jgi:hypothetical protein